MPEFGAGTAVSTNLQGKKLSSAKGFALRARLKVLAEFDSSTTSQLFMEMSNDSIPDRKKSNSSFGWTSDEEMTYVFARVLLASFSFYIFTARQSSHTGSSTAL